MSFIQPSFYNAAITLSLCVATLSNAQDIIYNIDVLNYEWVTNPIDPNNNSDNLTIERESAGTWTSSLPLGIGNSGISGQSAISLQIDDGELTIDHGISHHMASGNTLPTFSSVFTEVGVRASAPVGTEVSIRLAQGSQTMAVKAVKGHAFKGTLFIERNRPR